MVLYRIFGILLYLSVRFLAAYASAACMYRDVAVGARYECLSPDPRTKLPPSSLPIDIERPYFTCDVFKSTCSDRDDEIVVFDDCVDSLSPPALMTSSGDDEVDFPSTDFLFNLSFGIFMLLKRLLSRLLLFVGDFTTSDEVVVVAIGGGGSGQIIISSEIELPVGEIGGSIETSSSFLTLLTLLDFCCVEDVFRNELFSRWVTSAGSSSLEMVELHSEVTVRLDSGRSKRKLLK